jgi:hypothetical protein
MRASCNLASVDLDFRVNELEFRRAQLRWDGNDRASLQIIIEHPFLGAFAVHRQFVFELRSSDRGGTWEKVSLEQLKMAFLQGCRDVQAKPGKGGHERIREGLARAFGNHPVVHAKHLPRIPVEGDSSHIHRAEQALSQGGVRYRIVGGIGSRGRVWGHVTFLVDSLQRARTHLLSAGFLQSSESTCVLTDSENGWKIRLLECRPKNKLAMLAR